MNMEESNNGSKKLQIRNSTAEFLIFQIENKEEGIEVLYQDETLWLTHVHGFRNNLNIACRLMQEDIYFSLGEKYQPDVLDRKSTRLNSSHNA